MVFERYCPLSFPLALNQRNANIVTVVEAYQISYEIMEGVMTMQRRSPENEPTGGNDEEEKEPTRGVYEADYDQILPGVYAYRMKLGGAKTIEESLEAIQNPPVRAFQLIAEGKAADSDEMRGAVGSASRGRSVHKQTRKFNSRWNGLKNW